MQNDILLGEFIRANMLRKKFNESLWGLINQVCGGLKGSLKILIPKELCLSLFFSYASSLHIRAKLCKVGLMNPRALVFQKTKVDGRAHSHCGRCLRWDLHPAAYCEQAASSGGVNGQVVAIYRSSSRR